jgi:5-hydroxyisourate hydrolase-like protein (transthyretin family)
MNEPREDQEQHPPRWVPYTPPTPDGWDRVRLLMRRLSFPLLALLFLAGLAGGLYWSLQRAPADPEAALEAPPVVSEPAPRSVEGQARLTVRSTPPAATVRMNGDSVGTTPLAGRSVASGVYMLSVQAQGYFRADTVVVLEPGTAPSVRLALRPRPGTEPASEARAEVERRASPPSARPAERPETRPLPQTTAPPRTAPPTTAPARPATGGLYVTSTPTGAVVSVAGRDRGRTPVTVPGLPAGTARVSVALDGYQAWATEATVAGDSTGRVHAPLRPKTGRLRVLAQPWGTIYINGTLHARESDVWYETTLPAGAYRVTVVHPALGQRVQTVEVRPDDETAVVVDLQAEASP